MSKSCFDPSFKYTPAKEQGPDYLKKKFDAIRRQQKASQPRPTAKVIVAMERKSGSK